MVSLKKLLSKIAAALAIKETTVNGNFNCTVLFSSRCGIVTLVCRGGTATELAKGSWNKICDIPQGFRSYNSPMRFAGIDNNTNSAAKLSLEFRIESNVLYVYGNTDSATYNQPNCVVTYLGGVLRRPVIAILSAISEIGGGVSVKHKECVRKNPNYDKLIQGKMGYPVRVVFVRPNIRDLYDRIISALRCSMGGHYANAREWNSRRVFITFRYVLDLCRFEQKFLYRHTAERSNCDHLENYITTSERGWCLC